jgi:membrane-bound hydrogenase subunit beta
MKSEQVAALIRERFPGINVMIARERRINVYTVPERLHEVLGALHETGVTHVTTITCIDRIERKVFELLYHLWWENNLVTVRIEIPRDDPKIPTITTIFPGALSYEREIQGMFGIRVGNIPDPRRILLSDEFPAGVYPLRKDYEVK